MRDGKRKRRNAGTTTSPGPNEKLGLRTYGVRRGAWDTRAPISLAVLQEHGPCRASLGRRRPGNGIPIRMLRSGGGFELKSVFGDNRRKRWTIDERGQNPAGPKRVRRSVRTRNA